MRALVRGGPSGACLSMTEPFTAIICTGEPEGPKPVQNWHLARVLADRGHRVELVCDGCRTDLVGMRDGFAVATWPSADR